RWRLIRGAMTESVLLSVMGLAAAMLVATWGVAVLGASMPTSIPRVAALAVDGRVLAFASLVALGTGVVCGWFPAWHLTRGVRAQTLHIAGRGDTAGRGRQRIRAVLVVAEVAVAAMLVVAAG